MGRKLQKGHSQKAKFETCTRYPEVDGKDKKIRVLVVFKDSFETYTRPGLKGVVSCKGEGDTMYSIIFIYYSYYPLPSSVIFYIFCFFLLTNFLINFLFIYFTFVHKALLNTSKLYN